MAFFFFVAPKKKNFAHLGQAGEGNRFFPYQGGSIHGTPLNGATVGGGERWLMRHTKDVNEIEACALPTLFLRMVLIIRPAHACPPILSKVFRARFSG